MDALSGPIIAAYARDTGVHPSVTGQGKIVWTPMPTTDTTPSTCEARTTHDGGSLQHD